MENRIFIICANKDKSFARKISNVLAGEGFKLGTNPEVRPGEDWEEALRDSMEASDVFIVLFSENFKKSGNANFELGAAYSMGKKIIPVSIDGNISDLPWLLKNIPFLDGRFLSKNSLLESIHQNTVREFA